MAKDYLRRSVAGFWRVVTIAPPARSARLPKCHPFSFSAVAPRWPRNRSAACRNPEAATPRQYGPFTPHDALAPRLELPQNGRNASHSSVKAMM